MPTRQETHQAASRIVDDTLARFGNDPKYSWLGVYRALLWFEAKGPTERHLRIIDADKLRPSASRVKSGQTGSMPWKGRAKAVEDYIAKVLGCTVTEMPEQIDQLLQSPGFLDLQRQNPLGIAFIGCILHLLQRFGNPSIQYTDEEDAQGVFSGVRLDLTELFEESKKW